MDPETFQIEILDLETGQMTLLGKDLPKGGPVLSYPYLLYLQYNSEGKFPHYVLHDLKTKEELLLPISINNYHPKVVGDYIFFGTLVLFGLRWVAVFLFTPYLKTDLFFLRHLHEKLVIKALC